MADILNFWPLKLPYFLNTISDIDRDLVFTPIFSINYVKCLCKGGKNHPKSCQGERQDNFMVNDRPQSLQFSFYCPYIVCAVNPSIDI